MGAVCTPGFPAPFGGLGTDVHGSVIWLLYLIAKSTSGRRDSCGCGGTAIYHNTNWTESVLWISGQTISITALVVLWAMLAIWAKRKRLFGYMASWTSALAMGLLGSALLIYKRGIDTTDHCDAGLSIFGGVMGPR